MLKECFIIKNYNIYRTNKNHGIFVFEIELKKSNINKHFIMLPDNNGMKEFVLVRYIEVSRYLRKFDTDI